ncbi:aminoglycoside phosphotransferase [Nocardioides flavescens]|uniref:Glucosamine kinase n=1 Tax=Nocardioides flavescens TaxID=2691959 RepID=A0A6L7EUA0_9ACTN|nr:aminoglycoside phosphotransferase [Nocardioides flavescens]MXG90943.1 aminoglycoside phosphotransferase [Nocardioides flavescens]
MSLPLELVDLDGAVAARAVGPEPSRRLLALAADGDPLPEGWRWGPGTRPAVAVDGPERPVDVDQTNHSVVVGEQVVVKWQTGPLVGPHPAPERLRRLVAAEFSHMPAAWWSLEWCTPDGDWVPVVTAADLVPGASDGWTWCLHEARVAVGVDDGAARPFAAELGRVTAAMHLALTDPGSHLVAVHGDYHVGQVLRGDDEALRVVDFDGNPTLSAAERVAHHPAAYDVAGMLLSLENVGHVVRHHAPAVPEEPVVAWTEEVQGEFLAAYRPRAGHLLDETLLPAYVDEQIERELAYAEAHLPRWRYVPEAALRRRGRL